MISATDSLTNFGAENVCPVCNVYGTAQARFVLEQNTDFHFEHVQSELIKSIDSIKGKLNSSTSNASVLATLLEDPCLLKCITDLKSPTYGDGIDQFYTAKHDYARNSIIDKIAQEYSLRFIVGAEHVIKTGKLDVAISNNKIILCSGTKLIGIEIKTGSKTGPDVGQLIR
jgi:hypothetical protein